MNTTYSRTDLTHLTDLADSIIDTTLRIQDAVKAESPELTTIDIAKVGVHGASELTGIDYGMLTAAVRFRLRDRCAAQVV